MNDGAWPAGREEEFMNERGREPDGKYPDEDPNGDAERESGQREPPDVNG